jgi:hypothetical protein
MVQEEEEVEEKGEARPQDPQVRGSPRRRSPPKRMGRRMARITTASPPRG